MQKVQCLNKGLFGRSIADQSALQKHQIETLTEASKNFKLAVAALEENTKARAISDYKAE